MYEDDRTKTRSVNLNSTTPIDTKLTNQIQLSNHDIENTYGERLYFRTNKVIIKRWKKNKNKISKYKTLKKNIFHILHLNNDFLNGWKSNLTGSKLRQKNSKFINANNYFLCCHVYN